MRYAQVFTHPLRAGMLALAVVMIAAGLAASRLPKPASGTAAAPVEMIKRMPDLKLNISHVQTAAPAPAAASGSAPDLSAPQIARTARVSLYVTSVEKAAAAISRAAKQNGGDVFSSDIVNGDGAAGAATGGVQIRIPAQRFDSAMAAVVRAGNVRERSSSAEDLTGSITDSDARLRNLRRTEADIRTIMDRSGNVSQVMDAENQLSQVREQIETLESELKEMRGRIAYATIDVTMQAEAKAAPVTPAASSQLVSAWHDAVAALLAVTVGLLSALLWFVVFVPYLLAIAAVGWLVYLQARRGNVMSSRR